MAELENWLDYSELEELEKDDDFKDTFIPGEAFLDQVEHLGDNEYIQQCAELAREQGIGYADDQTSFQYELAEDHPLIQKVDEIAEQLGANQESVKAGVNIGEGFQQTLQQAEQQVDHNVNWDTNYENTPNVPHPDRPDQPTRELAYFIDENVDEVYGVAAGILASAYFEE